MSNKEDILNKMSVHIADELEELQKSNNKKELIEKGDVLFNLHKIICNYDEAIKTLERERKKNALSEKEI